MKVGTKSLLFGYHQFMLHPILVWRAWVRLYGWTWSLPTVASFFIHDLGYWGKPNMDGPEGKMHPFGGAGIAHFLFDEINGSKWYLFNLYHSRSMAKMYYAEPSMLCYADKLAFMLYPRWLLKVLYWMSGEGIEYRSTSCVDSATPCELKSFDDWYVSAVEYNGLSLMEEGLRWRR